MARKTQQSPDFATREEASIRLNLTTRQIDRLCKAGTLRKVKTSPARSAIPRAELDRYIAERTAGVPVPRPVPQSVPQPTSRITQPVISFGTTSLALATLCFGLRINLPENYNIECAEIVSDYIADKFPGILVWSSGSTMDLMWPAVLGYQLEAVKARITGLEATAALMTDAVE